MYGAHLDNREIMEKTIPYRQGACIADVPESNSHCLAHVLIWIIDQWLTSL